MAANADIPRDVGPELVDIESSSEYWNEYKLKDGTVLRTKTVLIEVRRAKDQYNQEGDPVYMIKSSQIVDARVPKNLKRRQ